MTTDEKFYLISLSEMQDLCKSKIDQDERMRILSTVLSRPAKEDRISAAGTAIVSGAKAVYRTIDQITERRGGEKK